MANQEYSVDFKKPLAFQVGHLGEAYHEWVHQIIVNDGASRLFQNEFIESLTRAGPWWFVPLVWLPIACLLVSISIKGDIPPNQVAPTIVAGILLWTLLEYLLHRFIFHIEPTTYWGITFHFLIHGCHHKYPMDGHRLVFPPVPAAIIGLILWSSIRILIPAPYSHALFGGVILGYTVYDCTHYYVHRGTPLKKGAANALKRHHLSHHFRILDMGFGVTSTFWDRMFGTLPPN